MVGSIESKNNPPKSKGVFFDFLHNLKNFVVEKFNSLKETLKNLNILKREVVSSSSKSRSQSNPEAAASTERSSDSVEKSHMSLKEKLTQICVRRRTYYSVFGDDCGSVSFGKLQFHDSNAEKMLNAIKARNPSRYASIMTDPSFSDVKTACAAKWEEPQIAQYERLMEDPGAQDEMDKVVDKTIQSYLNLIQKRGVTDPRATLAFGRICNFGPGFANRLKNKMLEDGADINNYEQVIDYYENSPEGKRYPKFKKSDPALGNKNIRQVISEYVA